MIQRIFNFLSIKCLGFKKSLKVFHESFTMDTSLSIIVVAV